MTNITDHIKNNKTVYHVAIIVAIYIALILIINPSGEFPLNDDWSHAYSAKHLADTGEIKILDWSPMSLVFQVAYGSELIKIFGFSFTVLRISTIILSLIGVLAAYFIFKELGVKEESCFIGSLIVLANPIYLNLSYTFMTDVPFLTMTLLSLLFYIKGFKRYDRNIREDKKAYMFIILASVFALFASLIRQPGIFIPIAALIYLFIKEKSSLRRLGDIIKYIKTNFGKIVAICALPFIGFAIYFYWFNFIHGATEVFAQSSKGLFDPGIILYKILFRPFIILQYIGLFLSPLILLYWKNIWNLFKSGTYSHDRKKDRSDRSNKWILISVAAVIILGLAANYMLSAHYSSGEYAGVFSPTMPFVKNVLAKDWLGPATIEGDKMPLLPLGTSGTVMIWGIITIISSICAMIIGSLALIKIKDLWNGAKKRTAAGSRKTEIGTDDTRMFIYLFIIIHILFFMATFVTMDRYLLIFLVPMMILVMDMVATGKDSKTVKATSKSAISLIPYILCIILIMISLAYSVLGTYDYMEWNQARWSLAEDLMDKGVSPSKIDGGFEFNNYYGYKTFNSSDAKYSISFSEGSAEKTLDHKGYNLMFKDVEVYSLKR